MVLVNDGSGIDLKPLIAEHIRPITYISKVNEGPASARNVGIEHANGKYIAFLDSDDVWYPNKLLLQIREMEKRKVVWSQPAYSMFWEESRRKKVIDTSMYQGDVFRDC